jgi:hypothetical protein
MVEVQFQSLLIDGTWDHLLPPQKIFKRWSWGVGQPLESLSWEQHGMMKALPELGLADGVGCSSTLSEE